MSQGTGVNRNLAADLTCTLPPKGITATLFFVIIFPVYIINGVFAGALSLLFLLGLIPALVIGGTKISASLKTADGSNDLIVGQIKGAAIGMGGGLVGLKNRWG